jgi:hypothetical protein
MTSAKAIIGGIVSALLAGLTSLATVLVGSATLSSVTSGQWVAVLIAVLTAGGSVFGFVWATTNTPAVAASPPVVVAPVEIPVAPVA